MHDNVNANWQNDAKINVIIKHKKAKETNLYLHIYNGIELASSTTTEYGKWCKYAKAVHTEQNFMHEYECAVCRLC